MKSSDIDNELLDQAVAFAEMWGTEQNWPHVRDAYVAAILRERKALALRSRPASALPVVGEDGLSFDAMFQAVEAVTSMGQTSADPLDDMVNRTTAAMKAYRAALIPSVQP